MNNLTLTMSLTSLIICLCLVVKNINIKKRNKSDFKKCYWCKTTILSKDKYCIRCGKNQF